MEQEPGRRIVSKGEYAKAQGKRALFLALGICLVLAAYNGVFMIRYTVQTLVTDYPSVLCSPGWLGAVTTGALLFGSIFGGGMLLMTIGLWGHNTFQKGYRLDPGVPLTYSNTTDLPAPESLVRASQEPVQAQATILLRAATEEPESQAKHLLRASAGGRVV